jgi:hypothetical protein
MPDQSDWLVFNVGTSGVIKIIPKNDVVIFSASGDALRVMREKSCYVDYLWSFAELPHRVTSMDIAHDVPVYTPKVLRALWRKSHTEKGIHLTRKKVPSKHIRHYVNQSPFDNSKTGTLQLGSRKAEAHTRVYDKRQEVFDKTGHDIGYWLTRYELTVTSKLGITLRDAHEPEAAFWHFMSEVISPGTPPDPWEPGAQGFDLPAKVSSLPAAKLRARVEASAELRSFVDLADQIGPSGRQYLLRLLQKSVEAVQHPVQPKPSATGEEGS